MTKVQNNSPSSGGHKPQAAEKASKPAQNSIASPQGSQANQHSSSPGQNKPKTDTFESSKSLSPGGGRGDTGTPNLPVPGYKPGTPNINLALETGHDDIAARLANQNRSIAQGVQNGSINKQEDNAIWSQRKAFGQTLTKDLRSDVPFQGQFNQLLNASRTDVNQYKNNNLSVPGYEQGGQAQEGNQASNPFSTSSPGTGKTDNSAAQSIAGNDGNNSAASATRNADNSLNSSGQQPASGDVTLFGGSQSGENNINFANNSGKPMFVYAQENLQPGQQNPGDSVFKVPAGGTTTVNAIDNNGLRFQTFNGSQLTSAQKSQLNQNGSVSGVTAPAQTGTLYESLYNPSQNLSYDDISPLDGANIPMSLSGNGGRTVQFTQQDINGAPVHNPDGTVPGLGPSTSSTNNNAADPALRNYYEQASLQPNGNRAFYYNSSNGGNADQANVSYTGSPGQVRTTVTLG